LSALLWMDNLSNVCLIIAADTFLSWRPRQYIFEGAEEIYDPDEEDENDSDSSSSDSSSCSSMPADENTESRDKDVEEELKLMKSPPEEPAAIKPLITVPTEEMSSTMADKSNY
jgi:hypothetical protein